MYIFIYIKNLMYLINFKVTFNVTFNIYNIYIYIYIHLKNFPHLPFANLLMEKPGN